MTFRITDLMSDVLPTAADRLEVTGCGPQTPGDVGDDVKEPPEPPEGPVPPAEPECVIPTPIAPDDSAQSARGLDLLRRQLHETLESVN